MEQKKNSVPKPNFVKKPMDKLMDEPLSKLPNKRDDYERKPKHRKRIFNLFDDSTEEEIDYMLDVSEEDLLGHYPGDSDE